MVGIGHGEGDGPELTSVALDVGDGFGALILTSDASAAGVEVEISDSADGVLTHAIIRRRPLGSGSVSCAVFPSLPEGSYRVVTPGLESAPIEIEGGEVCQEHLRASS